MKTTLKHFKIFKDELKYWMARLGLVGWEKHIEHKGIDEDTLANTGCNQTAKQFVITLNTEWPDKPKDTELMSVACHESLEVLFDKLESFARPDKAEEAREEVHAIIQTLLNTMWQDSLKLRKIPHVV